MRWRFCASRHCTDKTWHHTHAPGGAVGQGKAERQAPAGSAEGGGSNKGGRQQGKQTLSPESSDSESPCKFGMNPGTAGKYGETWRIDPGTRENRGSDGGRGRAGAPRRRPFSGRRRARAPPAPPPPTKRAAPARPPPAALLPSPSRTAAAPAAAGRRQRAQSPLGAGPGPKHAHTKVYTGVPLAGGHRACELQPSPALWSRAPARAAGPAAGPRTTPVYPPTPPGHTNFSGADRVGRPPAAQPHARTGRCCAGQGWLLTWPQ
jgi:hypothetical protein